MSSSIKSCFITAPAGSNLKVLTEALHSRGIEVVVPDGLDPGAELGTETRTLLTHVDLVIGVLTRERRSEWVLFELGQAWALGKRILLFAPPASAHLPSTLRRFLTVRANLSNREAIEFALDQLLAAPQPKSTPKGHKKKTRPLGQSATAFLQGSHHFDAAVSPADLETMVASALQEAGVEAVVTSRSRDTGADLAVWSDDLQLSVGNPLLVEIRARLPDSNATARAARQLSDYVAASGGRWGLLLFGEGQLQPKVLPPNVLAIPISNLFDRLQHQSFDDIVRDLRNRRVHGGSL